MKTLKFNRYPALLALLLCLLYTTAEAQTNYAVLSKAGKKKRYTFIEGQELTYKVRGDVGFFTDVILKVQDSALQFATYTLPYTDIETILVHKKKHIIPNKTLLTYGANILVSAGILEIAYRVNSGGGVHALGTQMAYLATPIPVFFLANWVYSWFIKTEYTLSADEYQLRPVILRKE